MGLIPVGFSHIDIVGEKVRIRPTRPTDAPDAYRLVTDEAVPSRLLWDGPENEEEIANNYRRWQDELKTGASYNFAVERADQPGMIGGIGPRLRTHPLQADIGYWLGVPFWNQGYMTDAVRLVCHLSFKYLEVVRVYATVMVGNMGSRRVLEKNGFSVDGTLRQHVIKRGEWRDEWFLSLLRSEWEQNRRWFTPRREEVVVVGGEREKA